MQPSDSTRERILQAARHLFQQRGYFAVGTADLLAVARAPKGSMYYHFPNGKEQIAIEAVQSIRDDLLKRIDELHARGLSVADITRALAKGMAVWLKESNWREGALLSSTATGSVPDLPKLHAAIRDAFTAWRQSIASFLTAEGWSKAAALTLAHTLLATMEGSMLLARIEQDERIVVRVADKLAEWLAAGPKP